MALIAVKDLALKAEKSSLRARVRIDRRHRPTRRLSSGVAVSHPGSLIRLPRRASPREQSRKRPSKSKWS
jgi:hypothetical protein